MAAGDITYATAVNVTDVSRLNSNANNVAEAFGEINCEEVAEINNSPFAHFHLVVPIHASATGGRYTLFLVQSLDGALWTDGIDPATSGDIAAKLADALYIDSQSTIYNATNRANVAFDFSLNLLELAQWIGFVHLNESGQTIPATPAANFDYMPKKVSA